MDQELSLAAGRAAEVPVDRIGVSAGEGLVEVVGQSGTVSGAGTVVQAGRDARVHVGDVNLRTGVSVRTRYRFQVERIAPVELVGREAELAELDAFCTDPSTAGSYRWWRAGAWAGKSALLSWFVLHPPPGVRVVSFFVTARLAGQSDRTAFIDNVLEQLLVLLDEDVPALLTPATREAHLLGLLDQAARVCRGRGERLVLVVDGLDEDRGRTGGAEVHTIAALLPSRPPEGLRVVVAGRPDPPVPDDVPPDHPLRDPRIVRVLEVSPRAAVLQGQMEAELLRLLEGTGDEQDLLGLLTASGGGLTAQDLADLTDRRPWRVRRQLQTVSGRSFTRRDSHLSPGTAPEVYLLAHEQLQTTAVDMLGLTQLAAHRARLHTWAEYHRDRGWPDDTPEYLLRGYHTMLLDTGDLERATALCTDGRRHDRLLALTGGDHTALGQITATLHAHTRAGTAALQPITRLAVHRDHLVDRNTYVPTEAPAVWARLGHHRRALTMAESLPDRGRDRALRHIVTALAETGHLDLAVDTTASIADTESRDWAWMSVARTAAESGHHDRAVDYAGRITKDTLRKGVLCHVLDVSCKAGDHDQAVRTALLISDPAVRTAALTTVADALITTGRPDEAAALRDNAESIAATITDPGRHVHALLEVAATCTGLEDRNRTDGLFDRAITAVPAVVDPGKRDLIWQAVARALAAAGLYDRGVDVASGLTDPGQRSRVLICLGTAAATKGHHDRAAVPVRSAIESAHLITDPRKRRTALTGIADELARAGMYEQAVDLVRSVPGYVAAEPYALVEAARGLARAGNHDRALDLAHSITDTRRRGGALAAVADVLAETGHFDRAAELAESVPGPEQRCEALVLIADTLGKTGRHEQATALLGRAIAGARSVTDIPRDDRARVATVGGLADTGRIDQAIVLAGSICDHELKVDAWNAVITALARAGNYDRATGVARDHAAPAPHAHALALVHLLGTAGQHDRALTMARSLAESDHFDRALHRVTDGLARAGHCDRAAHTAASISDPFVRAQASTIVARAWTAGGKHDHATALTDRIRTTIVPDIEPEQRCDVLLGLARVADMTGCHEQASSLFDQALDTAEALPEPERRNRVTIRVTAALARAGRYDRAVTSARTQADFLQRAMALTEVASTLADIGDYDRAISTAHSINEPISRPYAFGWIVWHMAHRGNYNGAIELIHDTGLLDSSSWALVDVVELTAYASRTHDALDIAHAIADPDYRGRALAVVAEVLAGHGDHNRANAVLRTALLSSPWRSSARTLALLAPDLALEFYG
ncbi:hypothetical protein ACIGNX_21995 [Actinosynnema sp. NPDC053489]|uniref:hypothetical protein n=1 Tax=Actinosynnema sp. NPDC053489 TaxID=3363916 RepID=UPI0037C65E26